MKRAVLTVAFSILTLCGYSQGPKSCCAAPGADANAKFVALADDVSFRDQHQEPLNSSDILSSGSMITYRAAGGEAHAYYIKAKSKTNKWLLVFHEWWGLNDQIKEEAQKLQEDLGAVNVLCLDLYDGKVATTRDAAGQLMQNADAERIMAIITGASEYVGDDAQIATVGWCFGGGWSLQAAIEMGKKTNGCVLYYGMPESDPKRLAKLESDVLGIFAGRDQWINGEVVDNFKSTAKKAGVQVDVHVFDADHAFANPTNSIYDQTATEEAYSITLSYLADRLMK